MSGTDALPLSGIHQKGVRIMGIKSLFKSLTGKRGNHPPKPKEIKVPEIGYRHDPIYAHIIAYRKLLSANGVPFHNRRSKGMKRSKAIGYYGYLRSLALQHGFVVNSVMLFCSGKPSSRTLRIKAWKEPNNASS